jgi:hypothetical protein
MFNWGMIPTRMVPETVLFRLGSIETVFWNLRPESKSKRGCKFGTFERFECLNFKSDKACAWLLVLCPRVGGSPDLPTSPNSRHCGQRLLSERFHENSVIQNYSTHESRTSKAVDRFLNPNNLERMRQHHYSTVLIWHKFSPRCCVGEASFKVHVRLVLTSPCLCHGEFKLSLCFVETPRFISPTYS